MNLNLVLSREGRRKGFLPVLGGSLNSKIIMSSSSLNISESKELSVLVVSKLQKLTIFMKELTKNGLFFSPFFDFLNVFKNCDCMPKPLI
jgi:hypothetical protein